ncbi:hypothetical protein C8R45DRAFT_1041047 [Mycena sanguinolenta]|nr:hypothetical protein C8R45DRAFT_1041047 [Mycena sanguinolenta]
MGVPSIFFCKGERSIVILISALNYPDGMFLLREGTLRQHLAPIRDNIYNHRMVCLNIEGLPIARVHDFKGTALPPDTDFGVAYSNHTLTVCPSPLAPDEYRVWVSIRKRVPSWVSNTMVAQMRSLRLRVPRSKAAYDGLQLHDRSCTPLASEGGWREVDGLTFSGHSSSIINGTQALVVCATDLDAVGGEVDLPQAPGGPPRIHVSPHAGAWSCVYQKQVVILYFE